MKELPGQPHQEVVAGRRGKAARQVQGAALGGGHRVPPAARDVEHVSSPQNHLRERRALGLGGGFDIEAERVGAGGSVQVPPLGSFELEDHGVVVVPVDTEGFGWVPGGVQVDLDIGAEVPLQRLGQGLVAGVELVDGVQD
nr:hypothetical protein [Streptomyces sp. SHP 1-2]